MVDRRFPNRRDLAPLLKFKAPELNAKKRRLAGALTIYDLRDIARRRTPRAAFDYTEGAAEAEISLARARQAFDNIQFTPSILRDVSTVDTSRSVLGGPVAQPFGIAPTGFTRMMQTEGEIAGATAAAAAGIPFALSTMGTTAIEDVAAANPHGRNWFQLYMWKDRERSMALVDRAAKAGFDTLLVTVDVPVAGARLRDTRNGMSIPPALTAKTVLNAIPRPAWWINFLTTEPLAFASLDHWSGTVADLLDTMFDPTVTFTDLALIKEQWPGKLVVKGVQNLQDAKQFGIDGGGGSHLVQPWRPPARPRADPVPPAARGGTGGGRRHRGAAGHGHHERRGHRGRHCPRCPLHPHRPGLPLWTDGWWARGRRPDDSDPLRADRPHDAPARCRQPRRAHPRPRHPTRAPSTASRQNDDREPFPLAWPRPSRRHECADRKNPAATTMASAHPGTVQ